jgi:hypothetical protein
MGSEKTLVHTGNVITGSLVDHIRRCRAVPLSKGQGLPMLIYGSPGVGKSEQVFQALEEGETLIDLRLNSLDSIDLRGLPVVKKDKDRNPTQVEWVRPEFIPWEGKGILFLDEINTAAPSVQNPALQLVLDRKVGSHKLGKDWYIVAAGNKADDKAHVYPLSSALRQRFAIYHYQPDHNTWTNWAVKNDIHPHVIGFISFKPDLLIQPSIDEESSNPSPRSWYYVSQRLHAGQNNLSDIRSVVGAAANEFMAYQTVCENIPKISDILDGKLEWKEDERNITVSYAVSNALATHMLRSTSVKKHIENCFGALNNMSGEPSILFMRRVMHSDNSDLKGSLFSSENGKKWFKKNGDRMTKAIQM